MRAVSLVALVLCAGCGDGLFDERRLILAADGGADAAGGAGGGRGGGAAGGGTGGVPSAGDAGPGGGSDAGGTDSEIVIGDGGAIDGALADRGGASDAPVEQCFMSTKGGNTLMPIVFEELTARVWLRSLASGPATKICLRRETPQQPAVKSPWVYVITVDGPAVPNEPLLAELLFKAPTTPPVRPYSAYTLAYRLNQGFPIWYAVTTSRADEMNGKIAGEVIMTAFEREGTSTTRFVAHVAVVVSCQNGETYCPGSCTGGGCQ